MSCRKRENEAKGKGSRQSLDWGYWRVGSIQDAQVGRYWRFTDDDELELFKKSVMNGEQFSPFGSQARRKEGESSTIAGGCTLRLEFLPAKIGKLQAMRGRYK